VIAKRPSPWELSFQRRLILALGVDYAQVGQAGDPEDFRGVYLIVPMSELLRREANRLVGDPAVLLL